MKTVLNDLQIVVERHSDVLRNNALPFRILLALRIIGFLVSPIASVYGFLTLLPFQLFSIEVWRLITCSFVGNNMLMFAWTLWSLHFGTNLVRQNNSNESLLKIYAITQVLTIVLVCGAAYVVYAFAEKTTLLYEAYIVDMVPLNCAVLVLIKQFLPDSILLETPLGRLKYTHTPLLVVLLSSLLSVLGVIRPVRHVDLTSLQNVEIGLRGLDSTARDAERRRQKALRDLNERLNRTKHMETIAWEEDIEDETNEPVVKQDTVEETPKQNEESEKVVPESASDGIAGAL